MVIFRLDTAAVPHFLPPVLFGYGRDFSPVGSIFRPPMIIAHDLSALIVSDHSEYVYVYMTAWSKVLKIEYD